MKKCQTKYYLLQFKFVFTPAQYLNKIECFCFQAQPLKAHETKQMTLVFYLDQKMPKEYEAITLAYKLYLAKEKTSL